MYCELNSGFRHSRFAFPSIYFSKPFPQRPLPVAPSSTLESDHRAYTESYRINGETGASLSIDMLAAFMPILTLSYVSFPMLRP